MSTSGGPGARPSTSPQESAREQLEADFTKARIVELAMLPVQGNFDSAHLREVNRRIFQDMPGAGFEDVTPGVYRPAVPDGQDWLKNRALSTVRGTFLVAYSPMNASARERIDALLLAVKPNELAALMPDAFGKRMAKLYAELDYLHPFSDGNSRTLRTFTAQLARTAGYELAWEQFNLTPEGRDKLYIARDLSVNEIALPKMASHRAMVGIAHAMDSLAGNAKLEKLLESAIRPLEARQAQAPSQPKVHQPGSERPEIALAREFERAMNEKMVPESLRPALRATFNLELQERVARGEFAVRPPARTPSASSSDGAIGSTPHPPKIKR